MGSKSVVTVVFLAASLLLGLGFATLGCGSAALSAAPAFSGVTLDGNQVSLDQFRGRPLLLVYMTSG